MPADPNEPTERGADDVVLSSPGIPVVEIPARTEHLKFSFRHLQLDHPKFLPAACSNDFYQTLLTQIRNFSSWRIEDFCDQNNREHRHQIWFPDTTEPGGFTSVSDDEQFGWAEVWQTGLAPDSDPIRRNYRIHGAMIGDTFFIIWLDPGHGLYSPG
jgi:hypothetical protein